MASPLSSARCAAIRSDSRAIAATPTGSRGIPSPDSAFASVNIPLTMRAKPALSSMIAFRLSERTVGSRSPQRSSSCAFEWMTVSGVFSSCDASEMNWRSRANASSRRASSASKAAREPADLVRAVRPAQPAIELVRADRADRAGQLDDRLGDARRDEDRCGDDRDDRDGEDDREQVARAVHRLVVDVRAARRRGSRSRRRPGRAAARRGQRRCRVPYFRPRMRWRTRCRWTAARR